MPVSGAHAEVGQVTGRKLIMKKADETLPNYSEQRKKQAPVADERARMPITDCTEADAGVGMIIGLGTDSGEQRGEPRRSPLAAPAESSPTLKKSRAKSI